MSEANPVTSCEIAATARPPIAVWTFRNPSVFGFWAIFVIAAGLRIYHLDAAGLWFDERYTRVVVSGHEAEFAAVPIGRVLDPAPDFSSLSSPGPWRRLLVPLDRHPPLYPLVLRAWLDVLGDSDYVGRMLSVVSSLAALALVFDAASIGAGPMAGLLACGLLAIAGPQIEYAQELRDYQFFMALGAACCAAALRLDLYGFNARRAVALLVCTLAMAITHYFAVGPLAALAMFAVLRWRHPSGPPAMVPTRWPNRPGIITLLAAMAGLGLLLAYVVITRRATPQYVSAATIWMKDDAPGHLGRTILRVAEIPMRLLCQPRKGAESSAAFGGVLFLLPFLAAWRVRHRSKTDPEMGRVQSLMLLAGAWLVCSIGVVAALDLLESTSVLDYIRYTLVASPMLCVSLGAIAAGFGRRWLWLVPLAAIAGCTLALPEAYDRTMRGEWKQMAGDLSRRFRPGDVIVVRGDPATALSHADSIYLGLSHDLWPNRFATLLINAPATPEQIAQLRNYSRVWLVTAPGKASPDQSVPGSRAVEITPYRLFAGSATRVELPAQ